MKPFVHAVLWSVVALAGCATPAGPDVSAVPPTTASVGSPSGPTPGPVDGAAASAPGAVRPGAVLTPFSSIRSFDAAGPWQRWDFHPTKRATRFDSVSVDGVRVVEALADQSVSGLKHRVDVDPQRFPVLEWRWRVDRAIEGADVADRYADDSPVRIVLAFDGDISSLPLKEQLFIERVKLLGGHDMPYATLMYVWCNRQQVGSIATNAHTSRVRKVVVESGPSGIGQWRAYRRDIVADYERAYGRKPGRLVAVAVMSDTDNTKQVARAWYGDIRLLEPAR